MKTIIKIIIINCFLFLIANKEIFAINYWSDPQNITVLNSKADEFAPCWNPFQNLLYFNSTKEGYSYYYTSKFENGVFSIPEKVKGPLNQSNNNQAYITFESEELAYVSTFEQYSRQALINIFTSYFKKNEWTKPAILSDLSSESFSGQATISPDNKFIIFASNKGSEQGDSDLWISYKESNGECSEATPITVLNSSGNELSPFLATQDTVYFSSNGWGGFGGYDIFYSVYENGSWQKPYPLTELNTEFDESDFAVLPNGYAVFSSNRPGGAGGLDLYLTKREIGIESGPAENEIEISISSQSTTISYTIEKSKLLLPIIPFISYEAGFFEKMDNENSEIESNIFNSKFLQLSSLKKIAERMKANHDIELMFECYSDKNKQYILEDFLKNLILNFTKFYNISKERLSYTFLESEDVSNLLLIKSNSSKIFEPHYFTIEKTEFTPHILNVSLRVRPAEEIKFTESYLSFKAKEIFLNKSESASSEFDINLENLGISPTNLESITIRTKVIDKENQEHIQDFLISIFEQQARERNYTINQNGKEYYAFPILIEDDNLFLIHNYQQYFGKITELDLQNKKVLLIANKELAIKQKNYLVGLLSEKLGISGKSIEFSNLKKQGQFFEQADNEFLHLIILVEK